MENINKSIAMDILSVLPEGKRKTLLNACIRNNYLAAFYGLPEAKMEIYKEGFYLKLSGTRSQFAIYARDNDGILEPQQRKPKESELHKLYTDSFNLYESDYRALKLEGSV